MSNRWTEHIEDMMTNMPKDNFSIPIRVSREYLDEIARKTLFSDKLNGTIIQNQRKRSTQYELTSTTSSAKYVIFVLHDDFPFTVLVVDWVPATEDLQRQLVSKFLSNLTQK